MSMRTVSRCVLGMCLVLLLLLAADVLWPGLSLFLSGFVKILVLLICLSASAFCAALIFHRRQGLRHGIRRR